MLTKFHKEEFPLNTVSVADLSMQFKVMKALGYRSLFDPCFRRELRNPLRRYLYYKLVIAEEGDNKKFLKSGLEFVADRIGFFTDPELFKKFKDIEMQTKMESEGIPQEEISEKEKALAKEQPRHNLTEEDLVVISDFLNKE